jgi:hypothetical protein
MTTTHTTTAPSRTLGETSATYATELVLAVLAAGAPGPVVHLTHPTGSPEALAGLHARWSVVRIHLATTIDTYCVPTSHGVVLMVTTPGGDLRCLPTWGLPAGDFGAAVLHLARAMATTTARTARRTAAPVPGAGPHPSGDFTPHGRGQEPVTAANLDVLARCPEARLWRHLPSGLLGLSFWDREVVKMAEVGEFLEVAPTVWAY